MSTQQPPPQPPPPAARRLRRWSWISLAGAVLFWPSFTGGVVVSSSGCRAISRYGESKQSIAARRLSRQGHEAMHAGQWELAEELFTEALQLTSSDDRAHWGLAEALWQRGERQIALKHMEDAVRLSASDPRLMRRLGKMYLEMGRLAEADQQSLAALHGDREAAEVWALRGDCLQAQGALDDALAAYHQALALQPEYPAVQVEIAELYRQQNRYDRLLATIDRMQDTLTSESPAYSRAHLLRGIALHELRRPVDAQRSFHKAIAASPDNPDPHLYLAASLLAQGDAEAAAAPLQQAIALSPQSPATQAMAQTLLEHLHATPATGVPTSHQRQPRIADRPDALPDSAAASSRSVHR